MMEAAVQKNECYTVEIKAMASEGNGVGKINGMTVFVPLTAPGDLALVRIVKVHRTYCYGKLEELLRPSADRVPSDCSVFSRCGGCVYRHIRYSAELAIKELTVQDAFERLGKIETQHLPIIGSKRVDEYRNKAQYPVGTDQNGALCTGFYASRSHRIVPCEACRLQAPEFEMLKQAVLAYADEYSIPAYDESTGKGVLRHICIRHAEQTGEWMVVLVVTQRRLPALDKLAERLTELVSGTASLIVNQNRERTNVILGKECRTAFGKPQITDILCGNQIAISPLSFYQVNRDQAEVLYGLAKDFAQLTGKETLIDLYCGTGTIGLSMADCVKRLIGVEAVPQAVEDAKKNAVRNGINNAEFLCADAAEATRSLRERKITPDVVVVDPPRKGCGDTVLCDIAAMAPERIVMISCNPATAARDCARLRELGYIVRKVQAVDMFPRTAHVECVVLLERSENKIGKSFSDVGTDEGAVCQYSQA